MAKPSISGQLIFREAGSADRMLPGENKRLVAVFGILAIPNESELRGEHQYSVSGAYDCGKLTMLDVHMQFSQDVSKHTQGNTPGGILKLPIWRV